MRSSFYAAVTALALSACGGDTAAVIEVRADELTVPSELDAFCLAVFDDNDAGGEFGRLYRFDDQLVDLPQTLTVEPGAAESAVVLARGYRGGIEVARDSSRIEFGGVDDVTLSLSRCPLAGGQAIDVGGTADLGSPGRVIASVGRGGTVVVALGADIATGYVAGQDLEVSDGVLPSPPPTLPSVVIAFDVDGDCDDDIFIGDESSSARLWLRQGNGFVDAEGAFAGAVSSARAAAVADTDADGDTDIVIGDATSLQLWKNDGTGRFTPSPGTLATDASSDVTALAFAELDGDGFAELIIGRGREAPAPVRVLAGQAGGGLVQVDAAAPETPLSVRSMVVRDLDTDRVDDVLIAVAGAGSRVFAGRGDGRLEDRSFVYFADGPPQDVLALGTRDWDGDCLADALISTAAGTETYRGSEAGFVLEETTAGAIADFADVDDDGDFDALLVDSAGMITWLKR